MSEPVKITDEMKERENRTRPALPLIKLMNITLRLGQNLRVMAIKLFLLDI